jgi:predicted CXXCH cytochrome family protein
VTDEQAFEGALDREAQRLGGSPRTGTLLSRLRQTIETTRDRFTGAKLLEVGIGCEACHGGAREHAENPAIRPSLLPTAPYLDVQSSVGTTTAGDIENHACARCHQVLFSRYPWTWEGGRRHAMPGGSHISSGEGRDLLLGGCKGALHCTSCHDPHASDESARLAELETPKGNTVCLPCHTALAAPDALRKHAHHDPLGAGGACIACHMAKKNLSLDGRLSRYHRIGSPTDTERVVGDRPFECALCHADRSVRQLTESMEAWWGKRYDREALVRSYGDLDANVLRSTVQRGRPHEKAVAMFVLGEAHDASAAPLFAAELRDEYPLVRGYAASALRSTFGDACDIDLSVDRAALDAALARCAAVSRLTFPLTSAKVAGPVDESPIED